MTRVVITKYFPEFDGRPLEEVKDFIEQDPRGMLQDADITIETENESTSFISEGFTKRRNLIRRAHVNS